MAYSTFNFDNASKNIVASKTPATTSLAGSVAGGMEPPATKAVPVTAKNPTGSTVPTTSTVKTTQDTELENLATQRQQPMQPPAPTMNSGAEDALSRFQTPAPAQTYEQDRNGVSPVDPYANALSELAGGQPATSVNNITAGQNYEQLPVVGGGTNFTQGYQGVNPANLMQNATSSLQRDPQMAALEELAGPANTSYVQPTQDVNVAPSYEVQTPVLGQPLFDYGGGLSQPALGVVDPQMAALSELASGPTLGNASMLEQSQGARDPGAAAAEDALNQWIAMNPDARPETSTESLFGGAAEMPNSRNDAAQKNFDERFTLGQTGMAEKAAAAADAQNTNTQAAPQVNQDKTAMQSSAENLWNDAVGMTNSQSYDDMLSQGLQQIKNQYGTSLNDMRGAAAASGLGSSGGRFAGEAELGAATQAQMNNLALDVQKQKVDTGIQQLQAALTMQGQTMNDQTKRELANQLAELEQQKIALSGQDQSFQQNQQIMDSVQALAGNMSQLGYSPDEANDIIRTAYEALATSGDRSPEALWAYVNSMVGGALGALDPDALGS